ncbi:MAG TPA: hypothetical protein VJR87_12965 [Allosphingosinicella sp.]|nr:hypothetical protein [Allosphingosinicella sp.]
MRYAMQPVLHLSRKLLQGLVALLLALTVAVPAIAESGCREDGAAHMEASCGAGQAELRTGDDVGGDEAAGQASHCAFSHASHAALTMAPEIDAGHQITGTKFQLRNARFLRLPQRDGPERPPQA